MKNDDPLVLFFLLGIINALKFVFILYKYVGLSISSFSFLFLESFPWQLLIISYLNSTGQTDPAICCPEKRKKEIKY